MNTPTLETNRLVLRRFTPQDLEALYQIYRDREVNRFLPWFPLENLQQAQVFYAQRYAAKYAQPQGYAYAICKKEDNFPIGYIKVDMDEAHDLGYGLRKEFWHQGIVTEAAQAVITQVKRDGLPYLTATHDRDNPRSGGVMQNIGMTYRYTYQERGEPKKEWVAFRFYQLNLTEPADYVWKGYWESHPIHWIEDTGV